MIAAIIAGIVSLLVVVVGDLVSDEVRTRLARLPRSVLRFASLQLPKEHRQARYDEWIGELENGALKERGLPLTGLITGLSFAFGHVRASGSLRNALQWETPKWVWIVRWCISRISLTIGGMAFFLGIASLINFSAGQEQLSIAAMAAGVTALMISVVLKIYRLPGGRAFLWIGIVTLVSSSLGIANPGEALSLIELVWLALAFIGLVSAAIGTRYRKLRRVAPIGMIPFPVLTAVGAVNGLRLCLTSDVPIPWFGLAELGFIAAWSVYGIYRYGAELLGRIEWPDGVSPLVWGGSEVTWSRISSEMEVEVTGYRKFLAEKFSKPFRR